MSVEVVAKVYLGDSVYAAEIAHAPLGSAPPSTDRIIVLTTEDGIHINNRIVLEMDVVANLLQWLASRAEAHEQADGEGE
jgi:hypothetical protein